MAQHLRHLTPRIYKWLQFRITSLLLLTAAIAAWLAFVFIPAQRAERAVESLKRSGAEVLFDYQRDDQPRGNGFSYSHQVKPPGPAALRRIAGYGLFQDADWIRLDSATLSADDLAPLAHLPSLLRITLTNCSIGDAHLVHFAGLHHLDHLDLRCNSITDAGLVHLGGLQKLETLSLPQNQIRGDGLMRLGGVSQLMKLFLQDNPLSDENLRYIERMGNLEMLALAGTQVTDAGLKHFANLKKLRYLGLTRTKVTQAGIKELQRTLPNCEVEY